MAEIRLTLSLFAQSMECFSSASLANVNTSDALLKRINHFTLAYFRIED